MMLARSFWLKAAVTTVAAGSFVWLYEVEFPDSKYATLPAHAGPAQDLSDPPAVGARITFSATAYCKGLLTSTGVAVQHGIVAADPAIIPIGSVLKVEVDDVRYSGIYTVLDTGPLVRGREVDIYIWNCNEALSFGRRRVQLTLLRAGWNPRATLPRPSVSGLFGSPESPQPLPASPGPIGPPEAHP
jgi:3D (Asp-Asp-Asp) domain-containing protein